MTLFLHLLLQHSAEIVLTFFRATSQLLKLRFKCEDHIFIFICILAVQFPICNLFTNINIILSLHSLSSGDLIAILSSEIKNAKVKGKLN